MSDGSLSAALEHEHREIDSGIKSFIETLSSPDRGSFQPESLTAVLNALRRHIYLEEAILFPPIREAGMVMPIFVMMREHGELWRTIDTLTDLLAGGATSRQLRDACRQLLGQLERHNSKEEPVIYPQADIGLPPQVSAELARFLDTGRIPDGWICRQGCQ